MISLARLVVERNDVGLPPSHDEISAVPAWQWPTWWVDLSPICPSRLLDGYAPPERRGNRNRLRIEERDPTPRCALQSPDGRGRLWLASGGSHLAYGCCELRACPLASPDLANGAA